MKVFVWHKKATFDLLPLLLHEHGAVVVAFTLRRGIHAGGSQVLEVKKEPENHLHLA